MNIKSDLLSRLPELKEGEGFDITKRWAEQGHPNESMGHISLS